MQMQEEQDHNPGTSTSSSYPLLRLPPLQPLPRSVVELLPPSTTSTNSIHSSNSNSHNNTNTLYWDRSHYASPAEQVAALRQSSTVYVGNLAFSTRTRHLYSLFARITGISKNNKNNNNSGGGNGNGIRNIVMGLDRLHKSPCGFAFVEFASRSAALMAVQYGSGSVLDGQVIRVELDAGFQPGRQYGRGKRGGQVRDDIVYYDNNDKQNNYASRKRSAVSMSSSFSSSSSSSVRPNIEGDQQGTIHRNRSIDNEDPNDINDEGDRRLNDDERVTKRRRT